MSLMDTAKDIYELVKKGATLDLQEKLIRFREEALSMQEENVNLKIRVQDLERELAYEKQVVYENPYYWRIEADKKDGPFCQKCYDVDKKLVRLQTVSKGLWTCNSCNKIYRDNSYEDPI